MRQDRGEEPVAIDRRTVYEDLVRRHAADLYRFAFRLAGRAPEAEDLVQETYFHAWRGIDALRDVDAGRSWLLTILRRRFAHGLRDQGRRPGLRSGGDEMEGVESPLPGPDLDLFARREGIQRALDRLDPRFKEAFLLVFLEGLSCREAAARLSVPLGTLLSRVHRARVTLRTLLREAPEGRDEGRDEDRAARSAPGGAS